MTTRQANGRTEHTDIHPDALDLARRIQRMQPHETFFIQVTRGRKGIYWQVLVPGDVEPSGREWGRGQER